MRAYGKTAFKAAFLAASLLLGSQAFAIERGCDGKAFASLIDETAQTLRTLNRDSERRFQEKLREIGRAKGWTEEQMAAKASEAMDDSRLGTFNTELEQLVSQLDTLSATPSSDVSCDRLSDLKMVRDRLVTVMGQKSGFILAQLDADSAKPADAPKSASAQPEKDFAQAGKEKFDTNVSEVKTKEADAKKADSVPPPPIPSVTGREDNRVAQDAPLAWRPHTSWLANSAKEAPSANSAVVERQPQPSSTQPQSLAPLPLRPQPQAATQAQQPPDSLAPLPLRPQPQSEEKVAALTPPRDDTLPPPSAASGYTVEEIREAGHGVFGKLSAELAAVINYAFKKFGEPNAYIIGDEGGGAFLAGLRYGEGKLYSRINGVETPPTQIFWQGPSVGMDIGATGSRSLFLIYNLKDSDSLYKRFPGIDGSAYVAGGFGLTVFKNNKTVIVPIRTGLGLRLGASLAYVKFTERASWNPF